MKPTLALVDFDMVLQMTLEHTTTLPNTSLPPDYISSNRTLVLDSLETNPSLGFVAPPSTRIPQTPTTFF
jgi:hypothetical protein